MVTINTTGESVAGSAFSLLCTATPPTPLVRPPVVSWVGVVNTDYDVTITESGSSVSESSLTLTFDPLKTSHGRVYICQADYDIPEADLPSRLSLISRPVIVQSQWCQGVCYVSVVTVSPPQFPLTLLPPCLDGHLLGRRLYSSMY